MVNHQQFCGCEMQQMDLLHMWSRAYDSTLPLSLSMTFNSPAFAQMIAQAVQAGINTTPSASAAKHNGGPSHNVDHRVKE